MSFDKYSWTDVEDLAELLEENHPEVDPYTLRFTRLREMVEALEDFQAEEGQRVNEAILEAIQGAWIEIRQGQGETEEE
jgi:FeS assembly protein IscX